MLQNIIILLVAIASVAIIIAYLAMEPKSQGAGSVYGQEGSAFGSTAHQAREKLLNKIMIVAGVVLMIGLIALVAL